MPFLLYHFMASLWMTWTVTTTLTWRSATGFTVSRRATTLLLQRNYHHHHNHHRYPQQQQQQQQQIQLQQFVASSSSLRRVTHLTSSSSSDHENSTPNDDDDDVIVPSEATNTIPSSSSLPVREVDCLVVGSGISGSCLAFHLMHNQKVDNVLLTERNPVVGGNVISKRNDQGFVWEEGPNSFQPTPAICQTVYELGLSDDLVLADGSLPRFVYYHGNGAGQKLANLHALPTNLPGDLVGFDLLTWPGKIRAGLGALGILLDPPPTDREESVREFVTRHLGDETFERIIDPFVSGVYAGDPDALSMRAALRKIHRLEGLGPLGPGLVSGAIARFQEIAAEKQQHPPNPAWPTYAGGQLGSFRDGLQMLPNRVAQRLGPDRVWTSHAIQSICKLDDGRFQATFAVTSNNNDTSTTTATTQQVVIAKAVSLTCPTRVTALIAKDLIPAAARLAEVYSPPVASVTMAYRKEWFKELPGATPDQPLRGFGHLLPRSMGVRSLGTIWSSSLFPGRAPPGWELLLTYIGGARDVAVGDLTIEDIYTQVDADVHTILLKPDAPAGMRLACRVWPTAIPQYRKGHLELLQAVADDETNCPGLFLGGNYRTGVAFGDCVQFGIDEAAKIATYLGAATTTTTTTTTPTTTTPTTTTTEPKQVAATA